MLKHTSADTNSIAALFNESIARAIFFLTGSRNRDGLWFDFRLADGSDEYVTVYVGTILSGTGSELALQAAREAGDRFASAEGGWLLGVVNHYASTKAISKNFLQHWRNY